MYLECNKSIFTLKGKYPEFDCLLEKYNQIEQKIKHLSGGEQRNGSMVVVILKLERLELKREIQKFLEEKIDV
ncbi:TPA: DUF465 domain-containing protein [Escherichia coli]|nr:DUF465 domain-containing protein [Escherichia coli]